MHLLDPQKANEFLNTNRRKRLLNKILRLRDTLHAFPRIQNVQNVQNVQDVQDFQKVQDVQDFRDVQNGNEECCFEGCTTEELLEYGC